MDFSTRLPKTAVVGIADIAAALGLRSTYPVRSAIERGDLRAVRVGRQFRITLEEARRWISSLSYDPGA